MNKLVLDFDQFTGLVGKLCRDISVSGFKPDYIVGLTRGGLLPAVMISHYFGVPMHSLSISLRDSETGPESNLWMAEDALGNPSKERYVEDANDLGSILEATSDLLEQGSYAKNILIVDDINDSGATLNWLMKDWQSSCYPDDPSWETDVWNNNVKFAVIVDNLASNCTVPMDYTGLEINKAENDVWVDFPYESWWEK